jgi:acyl-CoA thioester hydrolase
MTVFETTRTVIADDLDDLMHVNNVRYVQWVQETAKAHWEAVTTPRQRHDNIWLLVRHQIDYKSAAKLNDEIHIKTYVTRSEGVASTRHVEMYHKESAKLIIKSETIWCLLDAQTKKPKRISNAIAAVFNN